MADLTGVRRRVRDDWSIAIGLGAAIVAVVLLRTALFGWAPVAPDDARYLFVGMSVFGGDGPVTPSGSMFLLRSPVYGLALAAGPTVVGGDPIAGARVVALVLAIVCLLAAIRLGWLLAGPGGATGTVLAILAMPIVWRLVPSLRIDLPQTAGVLAILLAVWRPTARRWALGGVLFGVTILVKETVLPLALLPLAMVGLESPRRSATFTAIYLGAALVTAGWWWIVVWLSAGVVFPLNALGVIAQRDVGLDLRIAKPALVLIGLLGASWLAVAWRARAERGARLLLATGIGLAPAALYAASQGLNARNYAGLAVLSAIALGVAGAWGVAWVRPRLDAMTEAAGVERGPRRLIAAALVAAMTIGLVGGVLVGQRAAGRPPSGVVADELAGWLRANTSPGDRVAMTFKDRESMALRLFGSVEVANLFAVRIKPTDDLATYLWIGLRDRQAFGYTRSAWTAMLTRPPVRYLALSWPHPFHPTELVPAMIAGQVPGLERVASLDQGTDHADVFAVDAAALTLTPEAVPTSLSSDAALAWLELAAPVLGEDVAVAALLAARPVVTGDSLPALQARLGTCAVPSGPDSPVSLGPADACGG